MTGQVKSKGSKLSKFMTQEDIDFADAIETIRISSKELKQQEMDGLAELKEDLRAVKVTKYIYYFCTSCNANRGL